MGTDLQLLRDETVYPSAEELTRVLGQTYNAYLALQTQIQALQLNEEWRYYKDGKAWLCKVTYKTKTIFWLSVWDGFFKVGFYFAEKFRKEVEMLDISNNLIEKFRTGKSLGKLLPLTIDITENEQIEDVVKTALLKKKLK